MSPAIRLGGEQPEIDHGAPKTPHVRLHRDTVQMGGIETRLISSDGNGPPTVFLHGWMDNADTWRDVLGRLCELGRPGFAYDLPGFGTAPRLEKGDVLDQLVEFADAAVRAAAEDHGAPVIVVGNSLGGWTALRLAERDDLPIAGVVPIGPAGIRMAPTFFTIDRIPAVSRLISLPAPVPAAIVRSIVGRFYRNLAFAEPNRVDQSVVDRFTRQNVERSVLRERIDYAKRLRPQLENPFDADKISFPVTVIWGDRDRLCVPSGAAELAELLPEARFEMLEGIGHTPQVEAPDVVIEAIVEHCEAAV